MILHKIKFLCLADTHGRAIPDFIDEVDAVLCAGDFANYEENAEILFEQLKHKTIPVYYVTGNHESQRIAEVVSAKYNANCLDGKWGFYKNIGIAGIPGYNIFDTTRDENLYYLSQELQENVPAGTILTILLSHEPPYPWIHNDRNLGSDGVADILQTNPFKVVITGHYHEENVRVEVNAINTAIINPGNGGIILEIDRISRSFTWQDAFRFDGIFY